MFCRCTVLHPMKWVESKSSCPASNHWSLVPPGCAQKHMSQSQPGPPAVKVQVLFIATQHVQCLVDVVTVFLSNDIYCSFLEEFALNNGGLDFLKLMSQTVHRLFSSQKQCLLRSRGWLFSQWKGIRGSTFEWEQLTFEIVVLADVTFLMYSGTFCYTLKLYEF